MKLSAIELVNNLQNTTFNKTQTKKSVNNFKSTNSIASNTLQEAIGRSQVSFNGIGRLTKKGFTYEQKYPLSDAGEDIKYNLSTGELDYLEYNSNGEATKAIKFNPNTKTSVMYEYNDDYSTTKTTISKESTIIETKDKDGRQIYLETRNKKGKEVSETDYDRKRKVITTTPRNSKPKIEVFDLTTGKSVKSGPLVEDTTQVSPGVFETRNIITGQLYKKEECLSNKHVKITEYSKTTGKIAREIDVYKGESTLTEFNEKGLKEKRTITSKDGNTKTIIKYDKDGIREISKVENEYDLDRKLKTQTIYRPNSNEIQMVIEIAKGGKERTYHYYSSVPNARIYSETKLGDRLVKRVEYYDNEKSPKKITLYNKDKSYKEQYYKESGKYPLNEIHYFDTKNNMFRVEKYDTSTGNIEEIIEQHPNLDNYSTIERYDTASGNIYMKDTINDKNLIIERVFFNEGGKTTRKIIKYNEDRSFRVIYCDEFGKQIGVKDFNADKTPKNTEQN